MRIAPLLVPHLREPSSALWTLGFRLWKRAAIVGAAVGALHGRRPLPTRWLQNHLGRTGASDDGYIDELLRASRSRFGPQTHRV
jgi:hypothetical protein